MKIFGVRIDRIPSCSTNRPDPLTHIGKLRKQNPKLGNSPSVIYGNKIQKIFKNFILGTSPSVIYGNKIQTKILSTWSLFLFFSDFWVHHRASFTETKSSGIFRKNHSDLGLHKVVKDSWNNRSWKVLSRNV